MLLGEFRHSLDAKGRVFLPSRWREELGDTVVITQGLDRCLFLMGKQRFEDWAQRFDDLPVERKDARAYSRIFFAKASEEQVDGQGRITIPASLRESPASARNSSFPASPGELRSGTGGSTTPTRATWSSGTRKSQKRCSSKRSPRRPSRRRVGGRP